MPTETHDGPRDRNGHVRVRFLMQHAEDVRLQNRKLVRLVFQTDVADVRATRMTQFFSFQEKNGGMDGTRTRDLLRDRQTL